MAPRDQKWYGWRPDLPDGIHDLRLALPPNLLRQQPRKVFTAPHCLPLVRNQGDEGSCTGHAVSSLAMTLRNVGGQKPTILSPRFPYWNGRVREGTTASDAGCEIRDVMWGAAKFGFADLASCPYTPGDFAAPPSADAFTEALTDVPSRYQRVRRSVADFKAVIAAGGIVFGFSVFEDFESDHVTDTGDLGMPSGDNLGGHAVYMVGADDDHLNPEGDHGATLQMNSWDMDWGCAHPLLPDRGRGFFWMPYKYSLSSDLSDDFWTITQIT